MELKFDVTAVPKVLALLDTRQRDLRELERVKNGEIDEPSWMKDRRARGLPDTYEL